jgi:hypothetical protein
MYDGLQQYLGHRYCSTSSMGQLNPSGKWLKTRVDHMKLNYDLFLLIIIYYV